MGNVIENPFGNVRLQIVKLISSLLSMHNQQINERFAQLNTIKVLLVSINWYFFIIYRIKSEISVFH